jgi:hypothetical protein
LNTLINNNLYYWYEICFGMTNGFFLKIESEITLKEIGSRA